MRPAAAFHTESPWDNARSHTREAEEKGIKKTFMKS